MGEIQDLLQPIIDWFEERTSLSERLDSIDTKLGGLMALVDDLQTLLTTLQTDVQNLAAGQQSDQSTIASLQSQLADAQTAVANAQAAQAAAEAAKQVDDAQVADVTAQLQAAYDARLTNDNAPTLADDHKWAADQGILQEQVTQLRKNNTDPTLHKTGRRARI